MNIIGTGTKGFIALDFIREAPSAYDAISSAINDVRKGIPQAEIIEGSPNFVGVTDPFYFTPTCVYTVAL